MDAVASLTGIDEENVLMSLYARSVSSAKIVTKINRTTFSHIIKGMDLGSVFHPRYIAADHIVRYVRAMQNSLGSNVETLYKIVGNKAEALEFRATEKSAVCGRPLMELPTRPNLLIGAINREGRITPPAAATPRAGRHRRRRDGSDGPRRSGRHSGQAESESMNYRMILSLLGRRAAGHRGLPAAAVHRRRNLRRAGAVDPACHGRQAAACSAGFLSCCGRSAAVSCTRVTAS